MLELDLAAREPSYPASAAALGLWAAQSVVGTSAVFTIGQLVEFRSAPDLDRLTAAVAAAVTEADLLRARFIEPTTATDSGTDSGLRFVLGDPVPVTRVELRPDADADAPLEHARTVVTGSIDPRTGPCARIEIVCAGDRIALLIVAHHLVLDAYGLGLLTRRIGHLYDDPADPRRLRSVTDLPDGLDAAGVDDRTFWADQLAGITAPLTLSDRPRGHRVASRILTRRTVIPALGALTRNPSTLTAVIAAFCGRLAGTDDVVLGFPMMNRLGSPVANCACSTVNVIPLRVHTPAHRSIADIAAGVTDRLRAVSPHARYRGEDIVRDLRRRGVDGATGPTLNIKPFSATVTVGGHVADVRSLARGPLVDMAITAADLDGDLELVLDADADLYPPQRIDEIVSSIAEFTEAAARTTDAVRPDSGPTVAIGAVSLARAADERRAARIRDEDARTRTPIGATSLLERIAAQPADAIALICGAACIDHHELRTRIASVSDELGTLDAEDIVAVALPRGVDLVVALLAVHRSGAAFLPLDPGFPAERISATLDDADPVAVVEEGPTGVSVRRLREHTVSSTRRATRRGGRDGDPAYVIYTSGSTGTPKGVVVGHGALRNFTEAMIDEIGYRPGRSVLSVTTIAFDIALLETLVPLAAGATVVLADADDVHDPERLAGLLRTHRIDHMQATPSLWSALLDSGHAEALRGVDVLVGGEALPTRVAAGLLEAAASVRNMYGPTETTIWSTTAPVTDEATIVIGAPIANTGVRILDATLRPVPDDAIGELYLAGAGLARGYHRRTGLTATRFLADPFGAPGTRMYRTGDLARRRATGQIECLGRTDHQVKIRGFRVELGDIETALAEHDSIERAVVVERDGRLVAYATSAGESGIDASALRSHLARRLPDYMIPATVQVLEAIPLTPNGKVDRTALPAPDFQALAGQGRAPVTDTERILAEIVGEVLGVAGVGADDDFFVLGGDSLTAVRVVARAAVGGVRLTPLDVFDHPTVARLAAVASIVSRSAGTDPGGDPERGTPPHEHRLQPRAHTTAGIDADELDDLIGEDLL
ncbi:putative non-ribosomal peptide synthetase [Gordonia polyisoprenivorans VH2]|uniref:Putative non-ribosomal peptide synthetase n=1 Tax=Gordonia polyisoprenivorans (strain DSM 44266 / VH2) TaxID=1112204 RepID=H6N1S2_GORPV|nr:non-ribosomal peptide synthetase [Gordonia polyisoprenivorans]AFA73391.1 putative non-ribosomal peptide synthetase [Gordonia polyisoprenivorans VH2]